MSKSVKSDIGRFAIVPEWILDSAPGGTALRLFAVLACKYANQDGVAYPSRKRLAVDLGSASVDTVDRALKELTSIGAITVTARYDEAGDRTSNLYFIHFVPVGSHVDAATGGGTTAATGSHVDAAVNHTQFEPDPSEPLRAARKDEVWDAIVEAIGYAPTTAAARSMVGKAVKELKSLSAQPSEIAVRASRYRNRWPEHSLTPTAFLKHWDSLGKEDALRNGKSEGPAPINRYSIANRL